MRSALVRGVLLGVALLAVAGAVLARAGWLTIAVPRLDGPAPWQLARATGFTAFVALGLDVTLGLLMSTRLGDRWLARAQSVELHRWLSPIALALVLGHAAILLADGFVRFDALDLLVPFVAPYRPIAVGLGVIAMYVALVVHVSFALRKRLGTRTWRRLHYLSFVAFAAAALHAILAGSDAARPWALAVIGAPVAAVVVLVVQRLRR
jgi:sulfoxide reductase heme-binding subunit YedZ